MYRILVLLLTWTFYCSTIHAQQHYTIANGLPSNTVYNSFRDSKGYIWFCTDQGVSRFDGKNFKSYTTADGIPDNSVVNFFEDRAGRLWLYCVNGASCFIYNEKVFTAANSKLLSKIPVIAFQRGMCQSDDTTLYITYANGPLIKLNLQQGTITNLTPKPELQLSEVQYMNDTLYAYDDWSGIFKYYKDKLIGFSPFNMSVSFCYGNTRFVSNYNKINIYKNARLVGSYENIHTAPIIKVVPCNDNSFFVCTRDGLLQVDYRTHVQTWLFKGLKVTSVCQSISGNYWVTTLDKGIYHLNRELTNVPLIMQVGEDDLVQINDHLYHIVGDSLYTFNTSSLIQEAIKTKYQTTWHILAEDRDFLVYNLPKNTIFLNKKTGISYTKTFPISSASDRRPSYSLCIPYNNGQYFFAAALGIAHVYHKKGSFHFDANIELRGNGQRVKACLLNQHFYAVSSTNLREINAMFTRERIIDNYTDFAPLDIYSFNNHIMVISADKIILYTQGTKKRIIYNLNGLGLSKVVHTSGNKFIAATNTGYQLLTFLDTPPQTFT